MTILVDLQTRVQQEGDREGRNQEAEGDRPADPAYWSRGEAEEAARGRQRQPGRDQCIEETGEIEGDEAEAVGFTEEGLISQERAVET